MSFASHSFARIGFGSTDEGAIFADAWLKQCVSSDVWVDATFNTGALSDPCNVVILPQPDPDSPEAFVPATWAGIRFPSVSIAAGESGYTVQRATLTLQAVGEWLGFAEIRVHGDLQPQPPPYSSTAAIKARPQTYAQTIWQPAPMYDGDKDSVDVTAIVQELIDQPGRISDDPLAFILIGVAGKREFLAGTSPNLEIEGA